MADSKRAEAPGDASERSLQPGAPENQAGTTGQETKNTEEWGERYTDGKAIGRGGKTDGPVPGAEPAKE